MMLYLTYLLSDISRHAGGEALVTEAADKGAISPLIIGLLVVSGLFAVAAWLFFVWAVADKQFEDVEEPSKRLLELDAKL